MIRYVCSIYLNFGPFSLVYEALLCSNISLHSFQIKRTYAEISQYILLGQQSYYRNWSVFSFIAQRRSKANVSDSVPLSPGLSETA